MLKKGMKVSYTKSTITKRRIITISCHEGILESFDAVDCVIKARNGRIICVDTNTVRPADQHNALTEVLVGKT